MQLVMEATTPNMAFQPTRAHRLLCVHQVQAGRDRLNAGVRHLLYEELLIMSEYLDIISAISTTMAALAGTGATIFISLQVLAMKRSREVDTFLRVLDAGNGDRVRLAANWIKYAMNPKITYEEAMQPDPREKLSDIIHHFEMIGVLAQRKYNSKDLIYDQMGPWIVGSWGKLEPFILAHRAAKHAPDYAENFELLMMDYAQWAETHPAKLEKRKRTNRQDVRDYYK